MKKMINIILNLTCKLSGLMDYFLTRETDKYTEGRSGEMKLDRMLGITMELMSKKRVSATELADRFEVSVRTIYRDIELINQAGIPVVSYSGQNGGFELMNGFFLTKQHFSLDDLSVIYNLLKGMEGAMGGKSAALMNKLSSLQPALKNESLDKIIFNMSTPEQEKEIIHSLVHAINQKRVISFSYMSASGTCSKRRVEPTMMCWERGAWYLEGYCLLRRAKRIFRISRLSALDVSEECFSPRKTLSLPDEEIEGLNVHLRFDVKALPRVAEQFLGECVPQGNYIDVHKVFYSKEYAISVILSYGTNVEIISPEELKLDLLNAIKEIQNMYKKS